MGWRIRWRNPLKDIGQGFTGGYSALQGLNTPEEPPELAELRRRLASPQGYSQHEIEQMRAVLTQSLGIQRDQAIASMRQRLNAQGLAGSSMEMQQVARINSAYSDALARGMADIMARSAGQGRQDWQQTAGTLLGYEQLAFQQQQAQQQQLGDAAQAYAYTQGGGIGGGGRAAVAGLPMPAALPPATSQFGSYGQQTGSPAISQFGPYGQQTGSQAVSTWPQGQPYAGGGGSRYPGTARPRYGLPPQAPYPNWMGPPTSRYGGRPSGGGY